MNIFTRSIESVYRQKNSKRIYIAPFAVLCLAATTSAYGFQFDLGDVHASLDTTLSYGAQMRMQDPSCNLIARDNGGCAALSAALPETTEDAFFINADDGNLNYKKSDIVSQTFKGTHELFVKGPNQWSALARITELYDVSANKTQRTPLSTDAKNLAVKDFQLLDLFVSKEFNLFDKKSRIRVGNQVISWGESTFILGGINEINAVDVRQSRVPGAQLKEMFRPAPIISLSSNIASGLNVEGYYQWGWNSFKFSPVGTYFSTADVVGQGDKAIYLPTSSVNASLASDATVQDLLSKGLIQLLPNGTLGDSGSTGLSMDQMMSGSNITPRIKAGLTSSKALSPFIVSTIIKQTPALNTGTVIPFIKENKPDEDQYGLSLHYRPEQLDASFGIYYLNYSEKIPFITYVVNPAYAQNNPVSAGYQIDYPTNRNLFGVSTSFNWSDWAIGGEVSYRPKAAVAIDPSVPTGLNPASAPYACLNGGGEANGKYCKGWVDSQKWQAQVTGLQVLSSADGIGKFLFPLLGASEGSFIMEAGASYFPKLDPTGGIPWSLPAYQLPDQLSAGYVISSQITYPNAFNSGFNWSPSIDWSHGIKGNSPNSLPWQAGAKSGTLGLTINRQNKLTGTLAYTWFLGGGSQNLLRDRDYLGLSTAYSF